MCLLVALVQQALLFGVICILLKTGRVNKSVSGMSTCWMKELKLLSFFDLQYYKVVLLCSRKHQNFLLKYQLAPCGFSAGVNRTKNLKEHTLFEESPFVLKLDNLVIFFRISFWRSCISLTRTALSG